MVPADDGNLSNNTVDDVVVPEIPPNSDTNDTVVTEETETAVEAPVEDESQAEATVNGDNENGKGDTSKIFIFGSVLVCTWYSAIRYLLKTRVFFNRFRASSRPCSPANFETPKFI